MKINIQYASGRWLVNDKTLPNMNPSERLFMNSFFKEVKINSVTLENYLFQNEDKRA